MNILIVDDSDSILAFIASIVEELGYNAIAVSSGEAAIEYIHKSKSLPDLVILDVNMTGIDGYETGKQLKKIAHNNHLPIIFLTGARDPDIQAKCLSIGDDYIAKPFTIEMVTIKIKAHIRVSQLTSKMHEKNRELQRHSQLVKNEHKIVENIFSNHFKKHIIQTQYINFHMSPVSVFNGDVLLTATGPADNFYVLIGDVTGHGLPAAVGAIPIYSAFRTMAEKGMTVGSIAYEINKTLLQILPDHMMMAAALIEINSQANQLMIWSGGLPSFFIENGQGVIKERIPSMHAPLAAVDELEFSQNIALYPLEENDRIYLFTDGIEESRNVNNEMFSEQRLIDLFDGKHKDMFNHILGSLEQFTKGSEQDDDITLVELNYLPQVKPQTRAKIKREQHQLLPWQLNFLLQTEHLREIDPLPQIISLLKNASGIDVHQDFISTILSELYNNALEHGLLELDSAIKRQDDGFILYYQERRERLAALTEGEITIAIKFIPTDGDGSIVITVTDSGKPYNAKALLDTNNNDAYGRGFVLIKQLCQNICISDDGKCVNVTYQLQRQ